MTQGIRMAPAASIPTAGADVKLWHGPVSACESHSVRMATPKTPGAKLPTCAVKTPRENRGTQSALKSPRLRHSPTPGTRPRAPRDCQGEQGGVKGRLFTNCSLDRWANVTNPFLRHRWDIPQSGFTSRNKHMVLLLVFHIAKGCACQNPHQATVSNCHVSPCETPNTHWLSNYPSMKETICWHFGN